MDSPIWFIVIFFGIVFLLSLVHVRVNKSFKIEASWVAVAIAPAVIWLVLSGQLTELTFLGVNFKVREVSSKGFSLRGEGTKIQPESISTAEKGGSDLIDEFRRRHTEALSFRLGGGGYVNSVIESYFESLPDLRYVVFIQENDKFYALASVPDVFTEMRNDQLDLAEQIRLGDISAVPNLRTQAVRSSASRGEALQLMEAMGSAELPVVDENDMFVGVLDRDKLTSSIVADLITRQITD